MFRTALQKVIRSFGSHWEDPSKITYVCSGVGATSGIYVALNEEEHYKNCRFEERVLAITVCGMFGMGLGGLAGLLAPIVIPVFVPALAIATYEKFNGSPGNIDTVIPVVNSEGLGKSK